MPRKHEDIDIEPYLKGHVGNLNPPYVTVSKGQLYFAVIMWHNPEHGGFWEPLDTGLGRYPEAQGAAVEAQELSTEYSLPYHPLVEE